MNKFTFKTNKYIAKSKRESNMVRIVHNKQERTEKKTLYTFIERVEREKMEESGDG